MRGGKAKGVPDVEIRVETGMKPLGAGVCQQWENYFVP
jgi:hypothetical protein